MARRSESVADSVGVIQKPALLRLPGQRRATRSNHSGEPVERVIRKPVRFGAGCTAKWVSGDGAGKGEGRGGEAESVRIDLDAIALKEPDGLIEFVES